MTVTGIREGDGAFDPKSWLSLLLGLAEAHANRCDLDGLASDLAQQAFVILWERQKDDLAAFRTEEAERLVRRLADAERHARDVERRHLSLVRRDEPGHEPSAEPCPRLVALARAHARPAAFRTRLWVAAHSVARHPKVLLDDQFRIFDMVCVAGAAIGTAAELLGISGGAAYQRLRRASERLEKRLLIDLESAMPASRLEEMQAFLSAPGRRCPSRAVADAAFSGFGQVIHSRSLLPRIE